MEGNRGIFVKLNYKNIGELNSFVYDMTNGNNKADNIKLVMERNGLNDAIYVGDTIGDYNASVENKILFVYAKYGFGKIGNSTYKINEFKELLKLCYILK